jgi:small-conductance mechanosensitive channel
MNQPYVRRSIYPLLAALLLAIACVAPLTAHAQQPAAPTQPAPSTTAPPEVAQPAPVKPTLPPEVADAVGRLTTAIESAEKTIQHLTELEEELGRLRVDVESILGESSDTAESLRPQLSAVKSQIEKLGPPPAKDGPAESAAIAGERARLTALASSLDGAIKSTELTWVRARQLIEKITVLRHSLFTKNLMEKLPSPLLPELWRDLRHESPAVGNRLTYLTDDWLHWAGTKQVGLWLLIATTLLLFGVAKYWVTRLTDRHALHAEPPLPSFFERARSAATVAPLRALPAIGAAVLLYGGLDALDLLYPPWGRAGTAILKAIILYAAVSSLIVGVLAPRSPQWRLVSLANASARRVTLLLCAITAVYAIDAALTDISRAFFIPLALSVMQSFAASTAFAALLIGLLLTPFTPQPPVATESESAPDTQEAAPIAVSRHRPRWLKLPLWLIALSILGFALLGYVALARFIAQQLVMTGIVVAVGWLLYLAIRAVTREPQQRGYPVGEMLEARFGLDEPRRNQLARLTELALTFALVICAIPVLMLQWGFSGADIRDGFKALFFGLEVGQFRISLARILLGILLFIALLFTTRLCQRWLRERALQQTRMDPGIVNSIDTVVGYVGVAVAALLAVSYAGLDITNLAIVAGALSVGIGFGLQSIVNNFVSGLILLIERPIKVGDRIVVGDQQGLVRRISVRATEIETFDRASLIVPNSELITGRVLNWTHRDSLGAVNIKVGVSYAADPDQVIAILKKCADDHPEVLRTPAPAAFFENFGDSALMFNLRISLPDIAKAAGVQSELRIAVLKALRESHIEIPFNQIDVNLRDLDGVKGYLSQYLQERAGKTAEHPEASGPGASNGKRLAGEGS